MSALALCALGAALAQDAAADLQRAREALGNPRALSLDYVGLRTAANGTLTRTEGLVRRDGPLYYARQEDGEILIAAEGGVFVDHVGRTIRYEPGLTLSTAGEPVSISLVESAAGLRWLGVRQGLRCYAFDATGEFPAGELCFDPDNGLLASLLLLPTPLPDGAQPIATRVEVRYTRRSLEADRSQDWYDLDRVLSEDRRSPTPAYAGYRLIGGAP